MFSTLFQAHSMPVCVCYQEKKMYRGIIDGCYFGRQNLAVEDDDAELSVFLW